MEQRGALQEQLDRIGRGIQRGDGEGHRVDVVGHDLGRTRVEGGDAGHPAATAQVQHRLPANPGGLNLQDAGQQLTRRPDGRPEGNRLRRPALLLPRLPQGEHVRGVMGHEVRTPGHWGQRGQPLEQRGRGNRHPPERRGLDGTNSLRLRASHCQISLPRIRPPAP
jgi:hypothetical protein